MEWTNADGPPQYWLTASDAYATVLKLQNAGELDCSNGVLWNRGTYGYYWTSTQYSNNNYGYYMYIFGGNSYVDYFYKGYPSSLRCRKD